MKIAAIKLIIYLFNGSIKCNLLFKIETITSWNYWFQNKFLIVTSCFIHSSVTCNFHFDKNQFVLTSSRGQIILSKGFIISSFIRTIKTKERNEGTHVFHVSHNSALIIKSSCSRKDWIAILNIYFRFLNILIELKQWIMRITIDWVLKYSKMINCLWYFSWCLSQWMFIKHFLHLTLM